MGMRDYVDDKREWFKNKWREKTSQGNLQASHYGDIGSDSKKAEKEKINPTGRGSSSSEASSPSMLTNFKKRLGSMSFSPSFWHSKKGSASNADAAQTLNTPGRSSPSSTSRWNRRI